MRAAAALLILLAAAWARAGDPPSPDPIAAAKKDFGAIKSLGSSESAPILPSVDMKDLGPSPGARIDAPPPLPDRDASLDPSGRKDKEGTGNWLVDAMDKKSDRQPSSKGRDDPLKAEQDLLRDPERPGAQGERENAGESGSRERAGDAEAAGSVINPLDSFMAGWISARDHNLLLPAKADGGPAVDAGRSHPDSFDDLDLGQPGMADSLLPSPDASDGADSRGAPNPFIAALDLDPAPQVRFFSAPDASGFAPASQNGPGSPGTDTRTLDSGRSFIPDFAQPTDDDKYFKQMKKF